MNEAETGKVIADSILPFTYWISGLSEQRQQDVEVLKPRVAFLAEEAKILPVKMRRLAISRHFVALSQIAIHRWNRYRQPAVNMGNEMRLHRHVCAT